MSVYDTMTWFCMVSLKEELWLATDPTPWVIYGGEEHCHYELLANIVFSEEYFVLLGIFTVAE